jgi:hypothetical protein
MTYDDLNEIGKLLYNALPEMYFKVDDDDVLLAFVDAISVELLAVKEETANLINILDLDLCDAKLLPYHARNNGLNISEASQELLPENLYRRLIKMSWELNRTKGSISLLNYLAREIVGTKPVEVEPREYCFRLWGPSPRKYPLVNNYTLVNSEVVEDTPKLLGGAKISTTITLMFDIEDNETNRNNILLFEDVLSDYISVGITIQTQIGA